MSGPARISDDLLYDAGLTRAVLATVRREINGSEREAYNHWMLISERFRQHYQDATHETRSNPGRRSKTRRNPGIQTWKQWQESQIKSVMAEYDVSRADAEDVVTDGRMAEWIAEVKGALISGEVPSQAWINTVSDKDHKGWSWWDSFLHAQPDVFDRLFHAGRSSKVTKKSLHSNPGRRGKARRNPGRRRKVRRR